MIYKRGQSKSHTSTFFPLQGSLFAVMIFLKILLVTRCSF